MVNKIIPWNKKQIPNLDITVLEMYNNNIGYFKIAKKLKIGPQTAKDILLKNNIKIKDAGKYVIGRIPKNTRFDILNRKDEIIQNYKSGMSIKHISEVMKCSEYTITNIIRKYSNLKIINKGLFIKNSCAWNKGIKLPNMSGDNHPNYGKKVKDSTLLKIKEARAKQILPKKDTSIELKIQKYLKALGYEFFTHQYMKEIEHGYQCDILVPAMNLVIETDGDYWHHYPIGKEIDHIRTSELINKGFKVLRLWECEINKMSIEQFKNKLDISV